MNCSDYEALVALHIEGDLPPRQARRLEAHLAGCAACRDLAAAIGQSQAALKELRAEPVGEAVYAAVRARVLERVAAAPARRAWFASRWTWGAAAALAAAMLVALMVTRPAPEAPPAEVAKFVEFAPEPVAAPAPPRRPRARMQRQPSRPVQAAPEPPAQPLLVKLETNDPDVVIYWIIESNGDAE